MQTQQSISSSREVAIVDAAFLMFMQARNRSIELDATSSTLRPRFEVGSPRPIGPFSQRSGAPAFWHQTDERTAYRHT